MSEAKRSADFGAVGAIGYIEGNALDDKRTESFAQIWKTAMKPYGALGDEAFVVVTHAGSVQEVVDLSGHNPGYLGGGSKHKPKAVVLVAMRVPSMDDNYDDELPTLQIMPQFHGSRSSVTRRLSDAIGHLGRATKVEEEIPMPPKLVGEVLQQAEKVGRAAPASKSVSLAIEDVIPSEEGRAEYFESTGAARAAQFIRMARQTALLTQAKLAERLDVAQSRIAELERGSSVNGPTIGLLERIAQACGRKLVLTLE